MPDKAVVIIQARFNSKRLPGKVMLPLAGLPMFVYLIRRLRFYRFPYPIVLATTENAEDDIIEAWSRQEGVNAVRGEETDVLARYMRCLEAFPSDIIVRVTADNPLTEPEAVNRVICEMKDGRCDYASSLKGYPIGVGADAFSGDLLRRLDKKAASVYDREHINAYVLNHLDEFITAELPVLDGSIGSEIRFTVDTHEDYKNVMQLVGSYPPDHFIKIKDAIKQAHKRDIQGTVSP